MPLPLAPPPPSKDPLLDRWLFLLWEWFKQIGVAAEAPVSWGDLDLTGANLADIPARAHNDLLSLQGGGAGEYYHLTLAQVNALQSAAVLNIIPTDTVIAADTSYVVVGYLEPEASLEVIGNVGVL